MITFSMNDLKRFGLSSHKIILYSLESTNLSSNNNTPNRQKINISRTIKDNRRSSVSCNSIHSFSISFHVAVFQYFFLFLMPH